MAIGSREQKKILDLVPYLPKTTRPEDAPPAESPFDFIDVVDDAPHPPPGIPVVAQRITDTWKIFFWMVLCSILLGIVAAPIVFVFVPDLPLRHLLPVGFVLTASCIVTSYLNYRVIRWLASRLHAQVLESTREIFRLEPADTARLQATEVDRLDDALVRILSELKYQFDAQKRIERNDLIQTITALATALEARDPYTRNHSRSVARLTVRLGQRLGLSREDLYELHLAGLLHDIGKIGVPDQILLKPTRLTEEEMRLVERHVEWSFDILHPIKLLGQVGIIARHHHERFDGRGYPDRLTGEEIPFGARVMAVVDMFMAMTEDRPYRKGLPVDAAIAELRRVSGAQLDPRIVTEFLALLASDGIQSAEPLTAQAAEPESKSAAAN
jgi:HD-GYP domain-containing protein (c-di-GMP phosphodiesterase class II)